MGDKHVVRFEPVGIEIEVDEQQTVLRAAFDQGIMLMHGCKEGQCSSCKSFLLDGDDVELDKYSTFALPDFEREEGFTLLCRAHVYEDVTIELLNYDEEMIRSGLPVQEAVAEVVANEPVTHDMRHLVLRLVDAAEFKFFPGQYVDIAVPGTSETRSFSMANTSARESGRLEFIIKVYPDGLFSHFLDSELAVGDRRREHVSLQFVHSVLSEVPEAREAFWEVFKKCRSQNPGALRQILTLMVLYTHLGPFSRFVIREIDRRIAEMDRAAAPVTDAVVASTAAAVA